MYKYLDCNDITIFHFNSIRYNPWLLVKILPFIVKFKGFYPKIIFREAGELSKNCHFHWQYDRELLYYHLELNILRSII